MRQQPAHQDVDQLNSFLRGEISAVETYDQAIEKVQERSVVSTLHELRAAHQDRVALLRDEVRRRGGEPSEGSGLWGGFARLVEGGAKLFGTDAAIAALEEGEDHGRDDYRRALDDDDLGSDVRRLVESRLLPAQLRTHDVMSRLKRGLAA
jgi:uncharacterized protein (TIGR02284 family)